MKRVDGVQTVRVSLNEGLTILDLKPGNTIMLAELRRVIKNNGFVSKEAKVVARGSLSADQKTFTVSGTNEVLAVGSTPTKTGEDWRLNTPPPSK